MTASAEDLYQGLILDHSRQPRNTGALPGATHVARGDNPFCGDRLTVHASEADGRIREVRFEGAGCAISMACASMMTVAAQGKTRAELEALRESFERLLDGEDAAGGALGDLAAFVAVRAFPVRKKCARLPWQTLAAALAGTRGTASTE